MFPIITLSSGFNHVSQIAIMSILLSMTNSVNSVVLLGIDWAFMAHNLALGLHSTAAATVPAAAVAGLMFLLPPMALLLLLQLPLLLSFHSVQVPMLSLQFLLLLLFQLSLLLSLSSVQVPRCRRCNCYYCCCCCRRCRCRCCRCSCCNCRRPCKCRCCRCNCCYCCRCRPCRCRYCRCNCCYCCRCRRCRYSCCRCSCCYCGTNCVAQMGMLSQLTHPHRHCVADIKFTTNLQNFRKLPITRDYCLDRSKVINSSCASSMGVYNRANI